MIKIDESSLEQLRNAVKESMSPKRFAHTAAVEEMVARLCELFCPEYTMQLRAAALLHDITKEISTDQQIALCKKYQLPVTEDDLCAPKTFHARTAAAIISDAYPTFADPLIVSAIRWHTTGREDMTLPEMLLYLADYIDESRTFENCVLLRRFFWDSNPHEMNETERLELLRATMLLSYRMTIDDLLSDGAPIALDTVKARNQLVLESRQTK